MNKHSHRGVCTPFFSDQWVGKLYKLLGLAFESLYSLVLDSLFKSSA